MTTILASLILLAALGAIGESTLAAENTRVTPTTAAGGPPPTPTLSLDGENWLLDTDPENVGRKEQKRTAVTSSPNRRTARCRPTSGGCLRA